MDEAGLRLCALQGDLFAASAGEYASSSAVFVRRFMNSDIARRFDSGAFLYESCGAAEAFAQLDEEYGTSSYGKERFATEELYWMGYVYRYWCYTQGLSSKAVFKIVGSREMRSLYFPYHSLDPQQAIERMREAKGLAVEEDDTARGVAILRRLMREG